MNRRSFVLSWGRKLFFGLGWPIFSLIGLIYLQSFILPQSSFEAFYFITSFIGMYGLLCSVLYFVLYCPVVSIFPTYYFSRIWSLVLILLLAVLIFVDAYVFSQFRLHLNTFFLNLIYQKGVSVFVPNKAVFILFSLAVFAGAVVLWFRGNITWRVMQKRFSNPVSNWYLVLIVLCLGVSHLSRIYGKRDFERMQSLFPVSIVLNGSFEPTQVRDLGKLYYPKSEMKCTGKGHSNIVVITLSGLNSGSLTSEVMPNLKHMLDHGSFYQTHYSGSPETRGGLFSLFYSLPATYADSFASEKKSSVFLEQLKARKYQVVSFNQDQTLSKDPLFQEFNPEELIHSSLLDTWKAWSGGGTVTPPVFAHFHYDLDHNAGDISKIDLELRGLVLSLLHENILRETTIVITGATGKDPNVSELITKEKIQTPLVVIWPHRTQKEFKQFTSHYDVIPTLMRELWNCKNSFSTFSVGKALNDSPKQPWHIIDIKKNFALMDMEKSNFTRITPQGGFEVRDFSSKELPSSKGRAELTFKALKDNYRFYKR